MGAILGRPDVLGLLVELVGDAGGVFTVVAPACVGLFHALAVLKEPTASRIRRWTAAGFVAAVAVTILVVFVDLAVEGV
jgi:hypothetical protein